MCLMLSLPTHKPRCVQLHGGMIGQSNIQLVFMSSLCSKRILLGITGGIAAYKSAELVRRFKDNGADVRVVMTAAAQEFITPLTLQALSGNPVHTDMLDSEAEAAMGHIELARWGDLMVIAPCSADFLSKLCVGEASDLLSTAWLASSAKKVVVPAMNQVMWSSAATQDNIALLKQREIAICGPAAGEQACGDVGLGRMEEPQTIAAFCEEQFESGVLAGKKVVITAGPTREPIDPVRYISNHSSGKMGFELARAALEAGAKVTLIAGPVALRAPDRCNVVLVESALDMHKAALSEAADADVFIGAAAVADYRLANEAQQKIKKKDGAAMTLELIENPDIIRDIAALEQRPYVVGFAAETRDVIAYAEAKRKRKNLDMVVANDVSNSAIGFNSDNNAVTVLSDSGEQHFDQRSKTVLAQNLITLISEKLEK